jgi:hypothetical protein
MVCSSRLHARRNHQHWQCFQNSTTFLGKLQPDTARVEHEASDGQREAGELVVEAPATTFTERVIASSRVARFALFPVPSSTIFAISPMISTSSPFSAGPIVTARHAHAANRDRRTEPRWCLGSPNLLHGRAAYSAEGSLFDRSRPGHHFQCRWAAGRRRRTRHGPFPKKIR